jgi:hypothetical protein
MPVYPRSQRISNKSKRRAYYPGCCSELRLPDVVPVAFKEELQTLNT